MQDKKEFVLEVAVSLNGNPAQSEIDKTYSAIYDRIAGIKRENGHVVEIRLVSGSLLTGEGHRESETQDLRESIRGLAGLSGSVKKSEDKPLDLKKLIGAQAGIQKK